MAWLVRQTLGSVLDDSPTMLEDIIAEKHITQPTPVLITTAHGSYHHVSFLLS